MKSKVLIQNPDLNKMWWIWNFQFQQVELELAASVSVGLIGFLVKNQPKNHSILSELNGMHRIFYNKVENISRSFHTFCFLQKGWHFAILGLNLHHFIIIGFPFRRTKGMNPLQIQPNHKLIQLKPNLLRFYAYDDDDDTETDKILSSPLLP